MLKAQALLQFSEGSCLDAEASEEAIHFLTLRFASVSLPFMIQKGALRYAWLLPGELGKTFGATVSNKYGGFLYEFDSQPKCRFFPILGACDDV
jgi:hypothetical protein